MSTATDDVEWSVRQAEAFAQLLAIDDNKRCFECGVAKPSWASVTLGVFLCLNCAGRHRGYGVQVSFVRSLTLDKWTPKQLCYLRLGGNARARSAFAGHTLPDPHAYDCDVARTHRQLLKRDVYAEMGLPEDKPEPIAPPLATGQPRRTALSSAELFGNEHAKSKQSYCCNCCSIL